MLLSPAAADKCRLFMLFSYAWSFSLCWPLAKEHVRRNRQSRTFLVENVIGEIWSELEEGSVLGCLLPLLVIVYFHCWQKCIIIHYICTLGKCSVALKATCSGMALPGSGVPHVGKPCRYSSQGT